jgi:hypothetical protein
MQGGTILLNSIFPMLHCVKQRVIPRYLSNEFHIEDTLTGFVPHNIVEDSREEAVFCPWEHLSNA